VPEVTATPLVKTSAIPSDLPQPKPQKRGILRSINPLNIFQGDKDKPSREREMASAAPARKTPPEVAPEPESEPPPQTIPRYRYKSPPRPVTGDNAAALPHYEEGVDAQSGRRFGSAIQAYLKAVELDPAYYYAHYNLGICYAASSKAELALAHYETALAIVPDALEARYNFALTLQQAGYLTDAVNELDKVVTNYPNEARAHLALGNLYAQRLKQPALARMHYRKVLEVEPQHPQATAIRYWLSANP
jgi:tetratricopeptide (TPR) repeat protein